MSKPYHENFSSIEFKLLIRPPVNHAPILEYGIELNNTLIELNSSSVELGPTYDMDIEDSINTTFTVRPTTDAIQFDPELNRINV